MEFMSGFEPLVLMTYRPIFRSAHFGRQVLFRLQQHPPNDPLDISIN